MGWRFSVRAEKVGEEWWLNAGSPEECDLIPQNDRIQKERSCRHPFLYFSPSFLPTFFLFLISVSRNGNSVLKLFFVLSGSFFLSLCYPLSPSLFLSVSSPLLPLWSSSRGFSLGRICSLWLSAKNSRFRFCHKELASHIPEAVLTVYLPG